MTANAFTHNRLGTWSGILAILAWSSTVALARSLTEQVGTLAAGASAYTLAGLVLVAMRLWRASRATVPPRSPPTRMPRRYLIVCGLLFASNLTVLFFGIGLARNLTQVLAVGLLNYLWPTLTLLLTIPLLRQQANWRLGPGTLLALAGVFLALTSGGPLLNRDTLLDALAAHPLPYLLGLASAVTWALYSTLTRRWVGGGRGAVEFFMLAAGLLLAGVWWMRAGPTVWTLRAVLETIVLGLSAALAYWMWDYAMRRGNIVVVACCSYLTPLFSTLISAGYLSTHPSSAIWISCALIVAGSLLSWRGVTPRGSE